MHESSFENMELCYRRYVSGEFLAQRSQVSVLDVGSLNVNGTYRPIFDNHKIRYTGADLDAGAGVDIVLQDPYSFPFADDSFDIVISGQMLEHCEFFWRAFGEMMRVVRGDGYLFLIAPSSGPIHRFPVDCYRFFPDAFVALAKYARCTPVEIRMDDRSPWCDLVGVFSKSCYPATANGVI